MESAFLNLVRGTRLTGYMGLVMLPDNAYRIVNKEQQCVEVPLGKMISLSDGSRVDSAKRGQVLSLLPACSIRPNTYKVLAVANPALQEYASANNMLLIEPGSDDKLAIVATFRKDMDSSDLPWLFRLYLMA